MSGSTNSPNLFWDTCVIIRYLTGLPPDLTADIDLFIAEARDEKRRIYISSMMASEVKPSQLRQRGFQDFQQLLDAMQDAFVVINPNMNIQMQVGRLRDRVYRHEQMQHNEKTRVLTTLDAIHLATCIYVRDVHQVSDIVFHTLDDGKSKNYDERAVSLLQFEEYSEHLKGDPDVDAVRALPRCKPIHPSKPFI